MKASLRKYMMSVRWLTLALGAGGTWLGVAGCSSTSTIVPPAPPKEVAVPDYAYLPHPAGYMTSEIKLLFTDKSAPSRETMAKCDDEFKALNEKTKSIEERALGVRELVSRNPAAYHWCFYSRILELEEGLSKDDFVDEKQKRIVATYEYLVPVARAFMLEFQDSRYVRWAIRDYRRLADLYFYRKVELAPEMSSQLVDVEVPVDDRSNLTLEEARKAGIIDKYKIGNSIPDSTVLPGNKIEQDEKLEAAAPPPVKAPEKTAADAEVSDTMQYAQELAQQRKESSANRAPAKAPAQIPAPAQAPAPPPPTAPAAPTTPAASGESSSQFPAKDKENENVF